jgi:hypothetical protein
MDQNRFAAVTRAVSGLPYRRDVLRGLGGMSLGWGLSHLGQSVEAKKKGKDKPRKPKPNQYGCLEVGDPCGRSTQCCSGICKGKKGKKTCQGHGTATCRQKGPGTCLADNTDLLHCGSSTDCFCFRTTAGSYFCGDWFGDTKICHACAQDADCEALGLPGSACVPVARGQCAAANCEGGMMCMAPCGYKPPAARRPR